jgi:hypothetical protein
MTLRSSLQDISNSPSSSLSPSRMTLVNNTHNFLTSYKSWTVDAFLAPRSTIISTQSCPPLEKPPLVWPTSSADTDLGEYENECMGHGPDDTKEFGDGKIVLIARRAPGRCNNKLLGRSVSGETTFELGNTMMALKDVSYLPACQQFHVFGPT